METKNNFLGTGWGFPPSFDMVQKSVVMASEEQDVLESLKILLSTTPGERILRSDYGCNLSHLIYENITTTLLTKIRVMMQDAISIHEPRIEVENIFFDTQELTEGKIQIQVEYRLRATNSRFNYVFPYYIKEGTYVNR